METKKLPPDIKDIYTVWDYDARTVTRFRREGQCNQCGLCCHRKITFAVVNPVESENLRQGGWFTSGQGQWVETHVDGKRVYFRMRENERGTVACVHLGEDNRCKDYENRPLLCRTWPHSPFDLMNVPECSYIFQILGHWRFEELNFK
jgi:Fe-S-cluster containining protein